MAEPSHGRNFDLVFMSLSGVGRALKMNRTYVGNTSRNNKQNDSNVPKDELINLSDCSSCAIF